MGKLEGTTALVTGASAGIGEATARALASEGAAVAIGARRTDRLRRVADEIAREFGVDCRAGELDVTRPESCESFVRRALEHFGRIGILVNNAGLARGRRHVADGEEREWDEMIDTNVKGLLRMSRLVLPEMIRNDSGHLVNVGSVAGLGVYEGGSVYCASKWSVKAITQAIRLEVNGTAIRVTEVCPGLVETEFSVVRHHGDREAAGRVYEGMKPLSAADVADCILWAVTRPPHMDVDEIVVRPVAQAGMGKVARRVMTPGGAQ